LRSSPLPSPTSTSSISFNFFEFDLASTIPHKIFDAILTRNAFDYLSHADVMHALQNINNSGSRFAIISNNALDWDNMDPLGGVRRPLNLLKSPFNLPTPIYTFSDITPDERVAIPIGDEPKVMGVWKLPFANWNPKQLY